MEPSEVPEELLRRGVEEYQRLDRKWPTHADELVRDVLAAVLPAHEAQVRAEVAEEMAARGGWADSHDRSHAIKIARGETP